MHLFRSRRLVSVPTSTSTLISTLSVLCLSGFMIMACGGSDSKNSKEPSAQVARQNAAEVYFQKASEIEVQVWYQEAAEPYVRTSPLARDDWQILRGNLQSIFQFRATPPTITIPSSLEAMHKLSSAKQENWSSDQILSLASQNQAGTSKTGTSRFFIYFLDGYFAEKGVSNKNVLGVQIGDHPIIAIFKPVIASSSQAEILTPRFMEQSTLVHEMGHALGFVNHGVPMVENYQDSEHGAHSKDEDCVMFWLNEGTSNLEKFVQKLVTNENAVLWGANVLRDAKAFSK